MLRISETQIAAFEPATRRLLADQVLAHIQTRHRALVRGLPPRIAAHRAAHAVDEGWALGLRSPRAHCILAALMFHSGPGLARGDRFRAALRKAALREGGAPDQAIAQLPGMLDDHEWFELAVEANVPWPDGGRANGCR